MIFFKDNFRLIFLGITSVAVIFIWYVCFSINPRDKMILSFLDVGQGDAIFMEAPSGLQALIDGGPDRKVLSALRKEMPFFDRSVDLVVVSNPDKDHIAGLIDVLKTYEVKTVIVPGTDPDTDVYKSFIETAKSKGVEIIEGRAGQVVDLGGAFLEVLFPDRDPSSLDTNTGSIIARLVFGESSVILTGDAPSGVEDYFVKTYGGKLKSDILKVGHHGSKTSLSNNFFGFVSPEYAVISVGADNKYGHPHAEVLEALNLLGIEIERTDNDGAVRFFSEGKGWRRN